MTHAGLNDEIATQIFVNCFCFRRGLYDNERFTHSGDYLNLSFPTASLTVSCWPVKMSLIYIAVQTQEINLFFVIH